MKQLLLIMITLFSMSGCIFTPPTNERVTWMNIPHQTYDESDPILRFAKAQLGVRYRYGGMSPGGFDCSGFICYVYEAGVGKKLPRTAKAQSTYVEMLDNEALLPGDLLFFDTSNHGKINHSGIYLGEGKFIHASSGKVYAVTISTLERGFYKRAFRWGGRVHY